MRKKAIVTGASRGIGRGIIRELAAAGYDIAFSYRTREDEAKEAAEEIRNMGSFAWYAKADMAQAGEGEKFFDQAVRKLGGLDLLVNNAGVTVFQSILDLEMEETQKMLNLDLLNYLVLSSKAARYMKAHEVKGCIINITSSRAERAYPGDCVYGGIKAAVNRASQSMALDLAPYGIRVNCVAPGAICIRTPEEIKAEGRTELEGFLDQLNSGEGTFNVDGIDDVFATADVIKAHCGSNMMDCDSTSGFNALANSEAAMLISGEFSQNVVARMDNPPEIGYFALPVSNDAERNKAAVDVGIVYGVSTQTEHMDACKEVIDFLSDASLSDGYIAIVTEKPGSAPASQDFTVSYDSASTNDYLEYANSGNVIPWVYQQYVNGFDVISGDIFQGYMADAADKDEVISELDAAYLEYLDQ